MGRRSPNTRPGEHPAEPPRKAALREILRGGTHFNEWRRSTDHKYLDFSGLQLCDVDLRSINLAGVKLKGARFERVDLSDAVLSGANLNFAEFTEMDLRRANLRQARLESAIFNGVALDGANLFGTSRDRWRLTDVECGRCWITSDRAENPDRPDLFAPGEFVVAHGGSRIRVKFPGGIAPIDLLSLPFHAQQILAEYGDRQLILTGVTTVGEPALEFRVDDARPRELEAEVQKFFDSVADRVRADCARLFSEAHTLWSDREQQRLTERVRDQDHHISELMNLMAMMLRNPGPSSTTLFVGPVTIDSYSAHAMRDQYRVHQGGAVGPNAHAHDNSFTQRWSESRGSIDLHQLADELTRLRTAVKEAADTAEHDAAVGDVAAAEIAAREKDGSRALAHLGRSGKWTLAIAEKIGVGVAAGAIRAALGLDAP